MKPEAHRDEQPDPARRTSRKKFAVEQVFHWLSGEAERRRHAPAIDQVFASISFARHTIAEIAAQPNPRVEISRDQKRVAFPDAFPAIPCKKGKPFGGPAGTLRTCLTLQEESDDFFAHVSGESHDADTPHRAVRGFSMVRFREKTDLEFVICINARLAPRTAESMELNLLQLRAETIAGEFLACWLMYEELRETVQQNRNLADLRLIKQWHPEPWAVSRLLCPIEELRKSIKRIPGMDYSRIFDLVDEPNAAPKEFYHYWEHDMRVNRSVVMNAIASYLIENHIRNAMATFGALLRKRTLDLEDLKEHQSDTCLAQFWKYLADESPLNAMEPKREEAAFRRSVILYVENAFYWAKATSSEWGKHFRELRGVLSLDG